LLTPPRAEVTPLLFTFIVSWLFPEFPAPYGTVVKLLGSLSK
jgi:hypothetical protein